MAGNVKTHWVTFKTHVHPTAADVAAGTLALGSPDGTSLYITDSSGTSTVIGGGAAATQIAIPDNTDNAFRVYEGANHYIELDSVNGTEKAIFGNSMATMSTELKGGDISAVALDEVTVTGAGNVTIESTGGVTEIGGSTVRIGKNNVTDPVFIAATGARIVWMGSYNANQIRIRGEDSEIELEGTHAKISVKDGADFFVHNRTGSNVVQANFTSGNGTITLGDVTDYASQDLICDVREVQVPGVLKVTGTSTFTGEATFDNDIVLNDGGSLKEGGGTTVFTYDASGNVTKIGQSTPATNNVLSWDGTKAVWSAAAGGGVSNLSGLSDVADVSGASDNDILQYSTSSSEFEAVTVATALGGAQISQLGDVNGATPAAGNVLVWDAGNSYWEPGVASVATLNDVGNVTVTAGAGIDGYVLAYNHSNTQWEAVQNTAYSDAQAIAAVQGEATLDLEGQASLKDGSAGVFARVGGGSESLKDSEILTDHSTGDKAFFPDVLKGTVPVTLTDGYRYDIFFSGFIAAAAGTVPNWRPAVKLGNAEGTAHVLFATKQPATNAATQLGQEEDNRLFFSFRLQLLVTPVGSSTDKYMIPSGVCAFYYPIGGPVGFKDFTSGVAGFDVSQNRLQALDSSTGHSCVSMRVPNNHTYLSCGVIAEANHNTQNHLKMVVTGAWVNSFPGTDQGTGSATGLWP